MTDLQVPPAAQLVAGRRALAVVEMGRALRHPVFLASFGLSGLLLWQLLNEPEAWSTYHYSQALMSMFPLVAGTIATANLISLRASPQEVFGGAVPLDTSWRRQAQLLAGIGPVAVVAVAVALFGLGARFWGGDSIGVVQPQTVTWSAPELAQIPLLVAFSWAFGCALARLVPNRSFGLVVAFLVGFLTVGVAWIFQGQPYVTLVQVQPFEVDLGAAFVPDRAPADWILLPPGDFAEHWQRVVVSPAVAAGHDLFLVGVTLAWSAALWAGRRRWELLSGGIVVAVVGVAAQSFVGIG